MPLLRDGHSERFAQLSEPAQIAVLTILSVFVNLAAGLILLPFQLTDAQEFKTQLLETNGTEAAMLIVVIFGPVVETLIGQVLPLFLGFLGNRPRWERILWSAVWFAILHIPNGPAHMVQTFFLGWVFGATFLFGWDQSFLKAYRMTTIVHALHNIIVFMLFLLATL